MPKRKKSVLFFSSGDSTRSQIAAGFFRAYAGPDIEAVSTAVQGKQINPYAAEVMSEVGINISDQQPTTVNETFRRYFTCVVSLCEMSRERSPLWPFTRKIVKWNVSDPSQETASDRRELLRHVRDEIAPKVKELVDSTLQEMGPNLTE